MILYLNSPSISQNFNFVTIKNSTHDNMTTISTRDQFYFNANPDPGCSTFLFLFSAYFYTDTKNR